MTAQSKDLCIMTMFPARPVNIESPNQNHLGVFRHYAEVFLRHKTAFDMPRDEIVIGV